MDERNLKIALRAAYRVGHRGRAVFLFSSFLSSCVSIVTTAFKHCVKQLTWQAGSLQSLTQYYINFNQQCHGWP